MNQRQLLSSQETPPMPEEKLVRIGLIGLGGVCEAVHYPGYSRIPGVEVTALCDPDARLLQKRRNEWSVAACFTDVDELLNEGEIDAVVIATPNNLHRDLILKSLSSGRHVICEKPIGMSVSETEEIYEAARASGLRHMTAFTYRFVPAMTYIRHLITTGELGEITKVYGEGYKSIKNIATGEETDYVKKDQVVAAFSGMTALHAAAALGRGGACAAILADARFTAINARDARGKTARDLAEANKNDGVTA